MSVEIAAVHKAETLLEALPYIRTWRDQVVVVKVGGAALDDPDLAALVADDLALLCLVGARLVVVHGAGPQISAAMVAAGVAPRFIDGLRVTDERTLGAVAAELGRTNLELVRRLRAAGLSALGLSGVDAGLLRAVRKTSTSGDVGLVGTITSVAAPVLDGLLDQGLSPVILPLAAGADGELLNVNADEVAGAVAGALGAAKLIYLTNVAGLYADLGDGDSLISEISLDELERLAPGLSEGMRPKAESAAAALRAGTAKVHILDGRQEHALLLEIFTREGIGTQVLP